MDTSMNDPVALEMLRPDGQLRSNLVLGRACDRHAHRLQPTFRHIVQFLREVFNHERDGGMKRRRPGLSRPPLSTFAVLPPPTPGAGSGNGSPRGSRPPELPAGKRGGWHHDSVYPSFRLTSFAPRAMNFAVKCTSEKRDL